METRSLFVGPDYDFDWRFSFNSVIVQRTDNLKCTKHPENSVKSSSGWLSVKMTSGQYRGRFWIFPISAGENISHGVHTKSTACLICPLPEEVASLDIKVSECKSAAPAAFSGADCCHFHQRVPEAFAVCF